MPFIYKVDIISKLKEHGYNQPVSWENLETVCEILDCQPNDILECVVFGEKNIPRVAGTPFKEDNYTEELRILMALKNREYKYKIKNGEGVINSRGIINNWDNPPELKSVASTIKADKSKEEIERIKDSD